MDFGEGQVLPRGTQTPDLNGGEGPTQGGFSKFRPASSTLQFTGELPAEKSTLASLSVCPSLPRKINKTGSGLCDITWTPVLSPGCVGQEKTEGHSWAGTAVPQSHSPEEPETFRTASSHILTLQMRKLRPRERIKLS